jgi:hypothetical protein
MLRTPWCRTGQADKIQAELKAGHVPWAAFGTALYCAGCVLLVVALVYVTAVLVVSNHTAVLHGHAVLKHDDSASCPFRRMVTMLP